MTKVAVCIGVNRYPNSPLMGCVDDAKSWAAALEARGFEVTMLLDEAATRGAILTTIAAALDKCDRDSICVVTNSTHGTRVPDQDGDEVDGWDEAVCAYPALRRSDLILDDELYRLYAPADAAGVRVVAVADSCHSGTLQRLAPALQHVERHSSLEEVEYRRARWLSPAEWMDPADLTRAAPAWTQPRGTSRRSALVLAACRPDQVAYDAFIGGRYRGAFTAAAVDALDSIIVASQANYRDWRRLISQRLPSVDFDNIPQLDGTAAQKRWLLFQEQGRR